MKTLLIWAPIALKGLAALLFSPVGSNDSRLLLTTSPLKTFTCAEPTPPQHSDFKALTAGAGLQFQPQPVSLHPT